MRICVLTVARNEADRYLHPMIRRVQDFADVHFLFDDGSTDDTADIAFEAGLIVERNTGPSFMEDEGAFRESALRTFESRFRFRPDDWILVNDCDEYLATPVGEEIYATIRSVVGAAERLGLIAVDLPIPEVFGFGEENVPLIRIDRLWGTIHAPRLFKFLFGGVYARGLGTPAVPSYVMVQPWYQTEHLQLMHYGYADPRDQEAKYQRYKGLHGHSNLHVESILGNGQVLEDWSWPYSDYMRRRK